MKEIPGLARDPTDKPDDVSIRLLVDEFGFRELAVRLWSKARAATVLANCQREDRIIARRAEVVAAQQSGEVSRYQPSQLERVVAANYLAETLETGSLEELTQALLYSGWVLTDDETKRLVGWLVKMLRGEAGQQQNKERERVAA